MTRVVSSCMICLLLSVASPSGRPTFAQASSIRKSWSQQQLPSSDKTLPKSNVDVLPIALTNATNTTNGTATQAPTPAVVPSAPTPLPTPHPTKKYEPSPDDEEEKKGPKVGVIFGWIVFAFALIWAFCYFRDVIFFFLASAWNNTRQHGCKGCLSSFFPCIFGSQSGGAAGGSEPLDQIIFEAEDPNLPLMH